MGSLISLRDAMLRSEVSRDARRKQRRPGRTELPEAVEGQIEEICHDLAVQVKRMRQLQEQADELRTAVRGRARRERILS
jgi:polyhydroxyalkanoate synthesis regulator phasin